MSYITEIFERANLQQLRSFLLCGADDNVVDARSYKERINAEHERLYAWLKWRFQGENPEDVYAEISGCIGASEDVYTEIGLKAGFILAAQIFFDKESEGTTK